MILPEIKRLQNEIFFLREDNDKLVAKVEQLKGQIQLLQADLGGKNWMLNKALIDQALAVQEITYLKEQNTLLKGVK